MLDDGGYHPDPNENIIEDAHPLLHSEGLWLSVAKVLWGKDYIPLDSHDRASLNMILTMAALVLLILCVLVYIIIKNRQSSAKQRDRVAKVLRKNKLNRGKMNGIHDKTKKEE